MIPSWGLVSVSLVLITLSIHTTRISTQRYLWEFAGTIEIVDGTSNAILPLPSLLNFDALVKRHVDGTQSFVNPGNLLPDFGAIDVRE